MVEARAQDTIPFDQMREALVGRLGWRAGFHGDRGGWLRIYEYVRQVARDKCFGYSFRIYLTIFHVCFIDSPTQARLFD